MNARHNFSRLSLILVAIYVGVASNSPTFAKTTCQDQPEGRLCISQVDFNAFAKEAYQAQEQSQWCWAASISMLFSYYHHPVSQERVVTSLYGRVVNLPAGTGWDIASQVNHGWTDDNGKPFVSRLIAAYDFDAGEMTMNNNTLVRELDQDRPMIVGVGGHAMVATSIQYYVTSLGPNIMGIGVFDPWPGRGARLLDQNEMRAMHRGMGASLRFVAAVNVTDGAVASAPPTGNPLLEFCGIRYGDKVEVVKGRYGKPASESGGTLSYFDGGLTFEHDSQQRITGIKITSSEAVAAIKERNFGGTLLSLYGQPKYSVWRMMGGPAKVSIGEYTYYIPNAPQRQVTITFSTNMGPDRMSEIDVFWAY